MAIMPLRKRSTSELATGIVGEVWHHPANRRHRIRALGRAIAWQVRKRVVRAPATATIEGYEIWCYPDSNMASNLAYFTSRFDHDEMGFLDAYLRPGDDVIDVGANIGAYTLYLAARVAPEGRVLAVEPVPRAADRLAENLERNKLDRVELARVAASDASGTAGMLDLDVSSRLSRTGAPGRPLLEVPTRRLEDLADGLRPSFVKLDVEGAELHALRGASTLLEGPDAPVWMVEVYPWQLARHDADAEALAELMDGHGYVCADYDTDRRTLTVDPDGWQTPGNHLFLPRHRLSEVGARLGDVRVIERTVPVPLRPLVVINSLGLGGAEQSTAQLVEGLAFRGMDPHVVCLKDFSTAATDRVRTVGVDVRQLGCTRPVGAARRIRSIIEEVDPDLVHLVLFDSLLAGTLATMGSKVPVLVSVVSTPRRPTGAAVAARVAGAVETLALRRASAVHVVTPGVGDAVRRIHGIHPDRIHVAERGRDPETFARVDPLARAQARRELDLDPDAEVVLCVGRHEADKGIELLIEGLGGLDRPDLVVLVAGREGLETTRLQADAARSDHPERFRFLGHRDDVPTVLRAADVLAVPSLREGAAGSVIEAMAVGIPVAAFELEGLAGILEHDRTALLAADRRAGSLAAVVLALLDDPERAARIADAAHAQFLERFTLDAAVEAMAALYRSVAGTRR